MQNIKLNIFEKKSLLNYKKSGKCDKKKVRKKWSTLEVAIDQGSEDSQFPRQYPFSEIAKRTRHTIVA